MTSEAFIEQLPPLVRAAARGDIEQVRALLESGSDPNETDGDGWSALHAAATVAQDHCVVSNLIGAGATVDLRDANGFTPLLNAAQAPAEVVAALLEAGANPMAEEPGSGLHPLDRFAEAGNAPGLAALLSAGADPRVVTRDGWDALGTAIETGSVDCVNQLIAAGADIRRLWDGATAVELASRSGFAQLADLLSSRTDKDSTV